MKQCTVCEHYKDESEFPKDSTRKDGLYPQCRDCKNSIGRARHQDNIEEERRKQREYYEKTKDARRDYQNQWRSENIDQQRFLQRKRGQEIKAEVMAHYGKVCQCCGEGHIAFLSIDHINGGGNKHREEIGIYGGGINFYRWLKRNNFPEGYRVLCHNCNQAIGFYGTCPHQKELVAQQATRLQPNEFIRPTQEYL